MSVEKSASICQDDCFPQRKHRTGTASQWRLPVLTSISLISRNTFSSASQQLFALQSIWRGKFPWRFWFFHSEQASGRRDSMVPCKAVGWHEERQSLFYSRYLEMVQERYLQFHFCSYEQTLLSPHVFIPPIPLGTHGHLPSAVLQPLLNTQMPLCCLLSCSCSSKTGDKSHSIKARILYVCFPEIRGENIISPGHAPLPTASAGILKGSELSIINYLHFLIHSERQWHDHLIL